jgi:hypothetical protein
MRPNTFMAATLAAGQLMWMPGVVAAAPVAGALPPVAGKVAERVYYSNGHHYRYRYHGHYYHSRSYKGGHYHYY